MIDCNDLKQKLNTLTETFDIDQIDSYQLFLIYLYQLITSLDDLSVDEKNYFSIKTEECLKDKNLIKILTIDDLNELFAPEVKDLDLNNRNIYITIFNIILEELRSNEKIISYKIEQLIENILSNINDYYLYNNNNNNIETCASNDVEECIKINEDNKNNEHEKLNFDFNLDFEILNKDYLKEYIIRKNIIPYTCQICGISQWQNQPIILYLNSKEGKISSKNMKNLRFLCPNCYSQVGE